MIVMRYEDMDDHMEFSARYHLRPSCSSSRSSFSSVRMSGTFLVSFFTNMLAVFQVEPDLATLQSLLYRCTTPSLPTEAARRRPCIE